jgi:DUF971 family protein
MISLVARVYIRSATTLDGRETGNINHPDGAQIALQHRFLRERCQSWRIKGHVVVSGVK